MKEGLSFILMLALFACERLWCVSNVTTTGLERAPLSLSVSDSTLVNNYAQRQALRAQVYKLAYGG